MNYLENINSIEEIKSGKIPGYFFPKLIELGELIISPFSENSLGNICYYLHFNNKFRKPIKGTDSINLSSKDSIESSFTPYEEMEKYILEPGRSVIAQTYEKVGVSKWLLCKMENTSQLGRVFLNHASHGYLHPGHGIEKSFHLMIELTNLGEKSIEIIPAYQNEEKIIGPESFRFYVEKLAYPANEYVPGSFVPKLKMNEKDGS